MVNVLLSMTKMLDSRETEADIYPIDTGQEIFYLSRKEFKKGFERPGGNAARTRKT